MLKQKAVILIRYFVTPSMRFTLRDAAAWLRDQLGRAKFWQWEIASFPVRDGQFNILYAGRKVRRDAVKALIDTDDKVDAKHCDAGQLGQSVFVSEMPFPGALRVPMSLRVVMALGRPIEQIVTGFESELRRRIRKNINRAHLQQVLDDSEIDRVEMEMLRPFATARHGPSAHQLEPDEVRRIAHDFGRLDFVLLDGEKAACHLGSAFAKSGKRYWSTIRFGYPEAVFSDSKRLGETNAISFYLALEWAIRNGFDYFDLGTCPGQPEDSLLQWKKRWGGALSTIGYHDHFHVRLPSAGAAQFLWNSPLFAIEGCNLALHLGLPQGLHDDEAVLRYHKMSFGGLVNIYLHCARPPGENILEKIRGFYKHQKSPPIVRVIEST